MSFDRAFQTVYKRTVALCISYIPLPLPSGPTLGTLYPQHAFSQPVGAPGRRNHFDSCSAAATASGGSVGWVGHPYGDCGASCHTRRLCAAFGPCGRTAQRRGASRGFSCSSRPGVRTVVTKAAASAADLSLWGVPRKGNSLLCLFLFAPPLARPRCLLGCTLIPRGPVSGGSGPCCSP